MRHLFRRHLLGALILGMAALAASFPGTARAQAGEDFDARLKEARERLTEAIERETELATERLRRAFGGEIERAGNPNATPEAEPGAYLGLTAIAAPPAILARRKIGAGVLVTAIVPHGPAEHAGMLVDDVIVEINTTPIATREELRAALKTLSPGDLVEVVVVRDSGRVSLELMIGRAPEPTADGDDAKGQPAADGGYLGLRVQSGDAGLNVVGVVAHSPAAKAGIRVGDVITAIAGRAVKSAADLREIFVAGKIGDTLVVQVTRDDMELTLRVQIEKRPDSRVQPVAPEVPGDNIPDFPGRPDPAAARQLVELNTQGCNLLREGKYEEAIPYFERMLKVVPNNETALYNLACAYSLMGQLDKAVEYLEKSFLAGFTDWDHVEKDGDLDPLRENAGYKALMAKRDHFELVRAQTKLDQIKQMLHEHAIDTSGYIFEIDEKHKFIFATNRSREVMQHVIADLVTYAEAQWKHLFIRRQKTYIAIVLPTEEDFRKMVPNKMIGGFYNPQAEALISPSLDHTLTHEFTHALHFADILQIGQMDAIWFTEGLATCFENSHLKPTTLTDGTTDAVPTPLPNERLIGLKQGIEANALIPLGTMLRMNQRAFMSQAAMGYAQSRYFVMWIWQQGKLKQLHETYRETWEADPTGVTAVETVLGKSLDEIEKEWLEWVKALPPFVGYTGEGGAYLGAQLEEGGNGVRIVQAVVDGPAHKSGLRDGDVILNVEGKRIVSQHALMEQLANRKPGDAIDVVVDRGGEKMSLRVTLGARPAQHEHR